MYIRLIFLACLTCILQVNTEKCYGQAAQRDSLIAALPSMHDTAYIDACTRISDMFADEHQAQKAYAYSDSAVQAAIALNDHKWLGFAYNAQGNFYNYVGNYVKAIESFEKGLLEYRKINYKRGLMNINTNRGNTYFATDDLVKAEESYRAG